MKQILTIIVAVIIVIAATFFITKCSVNNTWQTDIENLSDAYNDTLHKVRNEKGQLETTTSVLETNNLELIGLLSEKDADIARLEALANTYNKRNSNLLTAIAINNEIITKYRDSLSNSIVDTIVIDGITYPTYEKDFTMYNAYDDNDTTAWVIGRVLLGKSDFAISLLVKNSYDIAIYEKRKNIFSRYETYITLTNRNPYDETKVLRTLVTNTPKKKRWVVFAGGGYGLNVEGFGIFVGIGIGYKLFEF